MASCRHGSEGRGAAVPEGQDCVKSPASARAPEALLAEHTVTQLSAHLHGELHGANPLLSIEEICFF